jgi:hypothetical protein
VKDGDYFNISIKIHKLPKDALQYLWCIVLTMFSPTCFGRYSGHLQGDDILAYYTVNTSNIFWIKTHHITA